MGWPWFDPQSKAKKIQIFRVLPPDFITCKAWIIPSRTGDPRKVQLIPFPAVFIFHRTESHSSPSDSSPGGSNRQQRDSFRRPQHSEKLVLRWTRPPPPSAWFQPSEKFYHNWSAETVYPLTFSRNKNVVFSINSQEKRTKKNPWFDVFTLSAMCDKNIVVLRSQK